MKYAVVMQSYNNSQSANLWHLSETVYLLYEAARKVEVRIREAEFLMVKQ